MNYEKQLRSYTGESRYVEFSTSNQCPMCHSFIDPIYIDGYIETEDHASISLVCNSCHRMFIARYSLEHRVLNNGYNGFSGKFIESEPVKARSIDFSQEINSISPRFVTIWNQAHQAEEYGLDEICGIGYRKAIEFLVKDYCIHKDPESKDTISKEHLSKTIDRLDNQRLISLGHAIRILGNDETHYISKESEGIDEMKIYISSLVNFIQFDLEAEHAENLYLKH